jgi:hypothetical protein
LAFTEAAVTNTRFPRYIQGWVGSLSMLTYRDIVATAKAEGYQSASKDRCYPKSQDMLYALKT